MFIEMTQDQFTVILNALAMRRAEATKMAKRPNLKPATKEKFLDIAVDAAVLYNELKKRKDRETQYTAAINAVALEMYLIVEEDCEDDDEKREEYAENYLQEAYQQIEDRFNIVGDLTGESK